MPTINSISATLTPEDQAQIAAAITTIRDRLPFLLNLSPSQRRELPKMGDKSRAFVQNALTVARQNPDILPRSFDFEEMERDVALFEAIAPLLLSVAQLHELLDDTLLAVGSEAYRAALKVYSYTKVSGQMDGLDAAMREMGQRFTRSPRAREEARLAQDD